MGLPHIGLRRRRLLMPIVSNSPGKPQANPGAFRGVWWAADQEDERNVLEVKKVPSGHLFAPPKDHARRVLAIAPGALPN
jgi:hypothetical protein